MNFLGYQNSLSYVQCIMLQNRNISLKYFSEGLFQTLFIKENYLCRCNFALQNHMLPLYLNNLSLPCPCIFCLFWSHTPLQVPLQLHLGISSSCLLCSLLQFKAMVFYLLQCHSRVSILSPLLSEKLHEVTTNLGIHHEPDTHGRDIPSPPPSPLLSSFLRNTAHWRPQ